jgi:hypothetical protein
MLKLMREWGFPVGLLTLWGIAAVYTVHALIGMQSSPTPVMTLPPVVIEMPRASNGS